jgi:hypothetical protein
MSADLDVAFFLLSIRDGCSGRCGRFARVPGRPLDQAPATFLQVAGRTRLLTWIPSVGRLQHLLPGWRDPRHRFVLRLHWRFSPTGLSGLTSSPCVCAFQRSPKSTAFECSVNIGWQPMSALGQDWTFSGHRPTPISDYRMSPGKACFLESKWFTNQAAIYRGRRCRKTHKTAMLRSAAPPQPPPAPV